MPEPQGGAPELPPGARGLLGLPYHYVALGVVSFGVFLATMDNSVVNIALPTLADEFDTSISDVFWVVLVFILVSTGLALTMGRLGDIYGRKRFYVAGFALYTVATALAAIAGSLPELLGARIVQGVGTSMIAANAAAMIAATFPAHQRGRGLGILGATVGAGLATGPVVGGVLIETLDWRAIFWLRAPLGLVGSLLAWRLLVDTPAEQRPHGLDLPGSALLFALLTTLVLAINRGDSWGWGSAAITGLFAASAALSMVFYYVERHVPSPVVALDLFKLRTFVSGIAGAILHFMGLAAVVILIPFYLVEVQGFDTLEAGGIVAAFPATMLVVAPLAGALADRIHPRYLTTLGLAIEAAALLWLASLSLDTPIIGIVLRLMLVGAGSALFQSPNMTTIMSRIDPQRLGTASASGTTARTVGQSTGVAIAGALFGAQAAAYALARSPDGLDDLALRPAALLSGMELAFLVASGIAVAAVLTQWAIDGLRGVARSAPAPGGG